MYFFTFLQSIVPLIQWREKEVGKGEKSRGAQKNETAGKKMAGQNTLLFTPGQNTGYSKWFERKS